MTHRMLAGAMLVVGLDAHVLITSRIQVKNLTLISPTRAPPTPPSQILKLLLLPALRQTIVLSQHVHLPCLRVAHSRHLRISSTIFRKPLGSRASMSAPMGGPDLYLWVYILSKLKPRSV